MTPVADAEPPTPDITRSGSCARQGKPMRRFQEGERVRTTRTAGEIFRQENVSEAVAPLPMLGTIVGEHDAGNASHETVYWRARMDEIDTEAIVADGDLMPLGHHPDSHAPS